MYITRTDGSEGRTRRQDLPGGISSVPVGAALVHLPPDSGIIAVIFCEREHYSSLAKMRVFIILSPTRCKGLPCRECVTSREALGSCVAGKDVFALILINQCCNYYCDVVDYVFMSLLFLS